MERIRDVDHQVVGGEGFRDVAVGAELERRIDDADVVVACDHDRRDVRACPSELVEQLEPGAARKPDVAEDDRELFLREQLPRIVDRSRAPALVPCGDDHAPDQRAHLRIVIDAQHTFGAHEISTSP